MVVWNSTCKCCRQTRVAQAYLLFVVVSKATQASPSSGNSARCIEGTDGVGRCCAPRARDAQWWTRPGCRLYEDDAIRQNLSAIVMVIIHSLLGPRTIYSTVLVVFKLPWPQWQPRPASLQLDRGRYCRRSWSLVLATASCSAAALGVFLAQFHTGKLMTCVAELRLGIQVVCSIISMTRTWPGTRSTVTIRVKLLSHGFLAILVLSRVSPSNQYQWRIGTDSVDSPDRSAQDDSDPNGPCPGTRDHHRDNNPKTPG